MKKITQIIFALLITLAAASHASPARAGSASISVSPASGTKTVGQQFDVSLVVNGGGQNFTTFGASVSVDNLTVVSLTKGSDVAKWTTEPSISSLNFFGGVSGSKSSVTAYTMKVKGKKSGAASISITNGSVKATDGYSVTENFSSAVSGSYTIKAASTSSSTSTTTKPVETVPAASGTSAVVAPVAPTLPDDQVDLEAEWGKFSVDPALSVQVGIDASAQNDLSSDNLTGVKLSGVSAQNSLVGIAIFSTKISKTTTADNQGLWSIVLSEPLISGAHTAYVYATKDGATARAASPFKFTVDAANKLVSEAPPISTGSVADQEEVATLIDADPTATSGKNNSLLIVAAGVSLLALIVIVVFMKKRRQSQGLLRPEDVRDPVVVSPTNQPQEATVNFASSQPVVPDDNMTIESVASVSLDNKDTSANKSLEVNADPVFQTGQRPINDTPQDIQPQDQDTPVAATSIPATPEVKVEDDNEKPPTAFGSW
ncbi:MAG: hypothetical protein WCT32_04775 [Patescibacteria group bacterium]|jgi:hypothetical protein